MPGKQSTNLYLIGDAGHDRFTFPGMTEAVAIPSGVFFMRDALPTLLGPGFSVESLISEEKTASSVAVANATPTKRAELVAFSDDVLRIADYSPIDPADAARKLWLHAPTSRQASHEMLVAHHAGETWDTPDDNPALLRLFERFKERPEGSSDLPRILVNLSASLPTLKREVDLLDGAQSPFESPLWNDLYEHRTNVGIIVSVSTLRGEGVAVSRRLSWEQGVEDLAAELHLFPRLRALTRFRHLFIRVGMVGFIHIQWDASTPATHKLSGDVYFDPHAKDAIHRDRDVGGHTVGMNTIFVAALARSARERVEAVRGPRGRRRGDRTAETRVRDAMRRALRAMRVVDDAGYAIDKLHAAARDGSGAEILKHSVGSATDLLEQPDPDTADGCEEDVLAWRRIPDYLLVPPPSEALRAPRRWHILDDVLVEAPVHRINVAMAMVKAGHRRVLNRVWSDVAATGPDAKIWELLTRVEYWNPRDRVPDFVTLEENDWPTTPHSSSGNETTTRPVLGNTSVPFELNVPITKFNELTLIERDETETLRGIRNLLEQYHRNAHQKDVRGRPTTPISIAVFGPPGSGKSFAVKQIAKAIGSDKIGPHLEFNVSQFGGIQDLHKAFTSIREESIRSPELSPLAFFDEFDCSWENRELGWLKFFLAPMQDGTFHNGSEKIGPAIFVFAGGVHSSFERFDPSTDSAYDNRRDSTEYEQRRKLFADQKGPDFTSRLRGHIDVSAINDVPGRIKHFIRRSIQLRSLLERANRVDSVGMARIDDAIVYALLTVDSYRHGVRSMQAVVEMCTPIMGAIQIASLPPRAQLNMHVDSEEFLIRVHRGRARVQPEWTPNPTVEVDWALRALGTHLPVALGERRAADLLGPITRALRLKRAKMPAS